MGNDTRNYLIWYNFISQRLMVRHSLSQNSGHCVYFYCCFIQKMLQGLAGLISYCQLKTQIYLIDLFRFLYYIIVTVFMLAVCSRKSYLLEKGQGLPTTIMSSYKYTYVCVLVYISSSNISACLPGWWCPQGGGRVGHFGGCRWWGRPTWEVTVVI